MYSSYVLCNELLVEYISADNLAYYTEKMAQVTILRWQLQRVNFLQKRYYMCIHLRPKEIISNNLFNFHANKRSQRCILTEAIVHTVEPFNTY